MAATERAQRQPVMGRGVGGVGGREGGGAFSGWSDGSGDAGVGVVIAVGESCGALILHRKESKGGM